MATSVECVFFGPLREAVGEKTRRRETDAGTVGELLRELEAAYPEMRPLVDDDGLADGIAVTHNRKHLRYRAGLETPLSEGDTVRLTTAVYGG